MLADMGVVQETLLRNEAETAAFAKNFARKAGPRDVICLYGGLGAGKTSFCRALIRELCGDEELEVPSPTFTLVQQYEAASGQEVWHFDLYRVEDPEEIYELGWEDALGQGLVLVEWPERLATLLPKRRVEVTLKAVTGDPEKRKITVKNYE